jgi:S1-C subfamily serine protease
MRIALLCLAWFIAHGISGIAADEEAQPLGQTSEQLVVQSERAIVKLYGAGGARGLESYQTGIVIGDGTLIVTSWSTVLDVEKVRVVTFDGRRLDAEVVGVDPQCELALLRIPDSGLPGYALAPEIVPRVGQRVFAISNLFGIAAGNESCSAQKGVIMAIAPLTKRKGSLKTLYQGRVLVIDVMTNNPGAAGGGLIDLSGRLVGVIGKELRDEQAGIWINYALPVDVVKSSVDRILGGQTSISATTATAVAEPHRLADLGLALLPDVLPKTPAFVDWVREGSAAARAGLQPNDLILLVNDARVDSRKGLERILATIDRADSFQILAQRGQELIRIQVRP